MLNGSESLTITASSLAVIAGRGWYRLGKLAADKGVQKPNAIQRDMIVRQK